MFADSTHLRWADRALAGRTSNLGGIWLVVGLCQTKYRAAISSRYHVPQWRESRASELVLLNENPLSESRTTAAPPKTPIPITYVHAIPFRGLSAQDLPAFTWVLSASDRHVSGCGGTLYERSLEISTQSPCALSSPSAWSYVTFRL